jgi:FkbM family methyltransferase
MHLPNEPWLTIPDSGRLALDVGANVGAVTLCLLEGFNQVHSFEPNPQAFAALRDRADGAAVLTQGAVGNERGELTLKLYAHHSHTSAFEDDDLDTITRGAAVGEITVPIYTLDGLAYEDEPVDFIKIDTEGFEHEVLLGARRTLRANMPELLVEIHAAANRELCRELLEALGYELQFIPHPHPGVPPGHCWISARGGSNGA